MDNNDVLRRLRYTFDFEDTKMVELFGLGDLTVTRPEVSEWLKRDDDPEKQNLLDVELAAFLNGLITHNRGKKEGVEIVNERMLNNNMILRKLKIALSFKDDDMMEIFDLANIRISKHEISAFFRNPKQNQYRRCEDQFLRNFLLGLTLKYRKPE
jgi:uncharacterized protein YehS (DUF1456 family)